MSASSSRRCRSARSSAGPRRARVSGPSPNAKVLRSSSCASARVRSVPAQTHCSARAANPRTSSGRGRAAAPPAFGSRAGASARLRSAGSRADTSSNAAATCFGSFPNGITKDSPREAWPARPALPAICRYDAGRIGCAPSRITARRAGRFTPAASVVVQHRTSSAPSRNASSMASFSFARMCAWCHAMPASAARAKPSGGAPSAAANSLRVSRARASATFLVAAKRARKAPAFEDASFSNARHSASASASVLFRDGQNARHECPSFADSATSANATRSAAGASAKSVSVSGTPRTRSNPAARFANAAPSATTCSSSGTGL